MPKYSGTPKDWDDFELTRSQYVNKSTIGYSKDVQQRFCLSMLPHCLPAHLKKEFDACVEDSKMSTWDEVWRAFRKEDVAHLPHHVQRQFKAVSLRTLSGHIRVADWRDFCREYPYLREYVEDRREDSEEAQNVRHATVQVAAERPGGAAEVRLPEDRG